MNDPFAPVDPFALDTAAEAAMEEFCSEPVVEQPTKPIDEFSRALQREYDNDEPQEPIRWPSGKPFVWGEFDPFAKYVDAETGDALNPDG